MPFQLTISEGKEAGREFLFDQPQVVIGRTPECDVCVYDPGISRKHARIYEEAGGFFVEDLNSSNGTKVNGSAVKKVRLADGDKVGLGAVVLRFEDKTSEVPTAAPVQGQETRIVAITDTTTRPRAKVSMLGKGLAAEEKDQLVRSSTTAIPTVRPNSRSNVPVQRSNPPPVQRSNPPPVRAEPEPDDAPDELAPARPATPSRARPQSGGQLSAAERARIRRQSTGPIAGLRIFWAEAGAATRGAFYTFLGLLVVAAVVGAGWYVLKPPPGPAKDAPPEPDKLSNVPIEESFGYGKGVTYPRPDKKEFSFIFNAPVNAVVILHFQAKDISSGEVQVFVNGASVAQVPADTLDVDERMNEVIVPPDILKKGVTNQIIFDNLHNPPGDDTWRIWNVWVETNLLPQMPIDQLIREATDSFQRGQLDFQRRDIGAENRFLAWKEFRKAWLMLEAAPDPKPELYLLSRDKMKEAQKELDMKCSQLMLEVEGYYNQHDWDAARSTLDHVKQYFPTNEQPCPYRAEQKRYELGL